jgi:simple sugar transport system ATP-binding protein
MSTILEVKNGTKLYGGTPAIKEVNFTLEEGEIHGLVGENGAGKSTLTKIMAGVVPLTTGELILEGQQQAFHSPKEALKAGVAMVFQEPSLVPLMTVAQNLYLGEEKVINRLRGIYIAAQQFMQSLNFNVDPTAVVAELGAAQKQMIEIARAVLHNAKVIVFDEPTASLTPEEKQHFFDLVKNLKERGVTIIFISHAIEEALELADRITVMRDAEVVITDDAEKFDRDIIINHMVGRNLSSELYDRESASRGMGRRILSIQNIRKGDLVRNNSLSIFEGQITGVFGLVGSGRTETFKVAAGVLKRDFLYGGTIYFKGKPVRYRVPSQAVSDGIMYVTEDRKVEGFFETMNTSRNTYSGFLVILGWMKQLLDRRRERALGESQINKLHIAGAQDNVTVNELSGGNQQKVVISKSLVQEPELVIFDEPTRGVDVGSIAGIHEIIRSLADEGKAVVVISSYLPEVMTISDRILVSRQGRIVEEFQHGEATEEKIMYAAVH